jgi:HSP20 family protein
MTMNRHYGSGVPEDARSERPEFSPAVDIHDEGQEIVLVADMPGVSGDRLDIQLDRGELSIRGRVDPPAEEGSPALQEYLTGDFARTFTVNDEIDPEGISAELKAGVLTLRLKKPTARTPRKIQVKQG